jgi:hypothetical protein
MKKLVFERLEMVSVALAFAKEGLAEGDVEMVQRHLSIARKYIDEVLDYLGESHEKRERAVQEEGAARQG